MTDDPQKFLEVALEAVKKAEPIFVHSFGNAAGVAEKVENSYRSPVTDVDKEIETLITAHLAKSFPEHSISGEELPPQKKAGSYTWIIDPIDGTTNYIRGLPCASISVALWEDDKPLVGIVSDPMTHTLFSAVRGQGAFRNRTEKLACSTVSRLADGMGNVGRTTARPDSAALERVARNIYRGREFGSSALELCYIAEGKLDLFISERIKICDVAASALILIEAGGRVSDWEGNAFIPASKNIVASNGKIHEELLKELRG